MKPQRQVKRSKITLHPNFLPIPDEPIVEIVSRLPSKAIARCRCVCKLWSSMLRRQDFTDSFLTKSSARPQILFVCDDDTNTLFFSSPQPENPEENSYVVASNHLARFPSSYKLFGSTNGLLCYGVDRIFKPLKKPVCVPVICNPSTGQSLTLPRLKWTKRFGVESYHGYLGYEPIAKELKVLSMIVSFVNGMRISVGHQVLTLGTNRLSWRVVDCCIPHCSSTKWICISGVLYYIATAGRSMVESIIVCFDLRSEKFSFVKLLGTFCRAMHDSTTMVDYNGKLGLLMPRDSTDINGASKSIEMWVLQDAEWSNHVFELPPLWEDVVSEYMRIAGMAGSNVIVLAPWFQRVPSYLIYFNIERKTITKVGIQGLEAFHGKRFDTYLNYAENVKLL